ncbi:MAG TPA: UDP-glucose--hexose-1-phosphate uridylyltransferase [Myxococcota bacterium]
MSAFERLPHRRLNPLTGDHVVVSPHRLQRPWQGSQQAPVVEHRPAHDAACPLCARNTRANGEVNPDYAGTFAFTNDFAALKGDVDDADVALLSSDDGPYQTSAATGTCRVLCFSPRHDLSLAQMDVDAIAAVVDLWADESRALFAKHRAVQVFENRGEMMGASMPHPHGQAWASDFVPSIVAVEELRQREWKQQHGRALLSEVVERELAVGTRVVLASSHFVVVVPFWAAWPFETLVLPRTPVARLDHLDVVARRDLASVLQQLLRAYDTVFDAPFPYSMGFHQSTSGDVDDGVVLHAHFFPPLLRSASVRKFMVGFEMLGETQRDLTPENAAARLRACLPEPT